MGRMKLEVAEASALHSELAESLDHPGLQRCGSPRKVLESKGPLFPLLTASQPRLTVLSAASIKPQAGPATFPQQAATFQRCNSSNGNGAYCSK